MSGSEYNIATADQEQAELRRVLRLLVEQYPTLAETDEARLGVAYLRLRSLLPAYEDMSCAAAELLLMVVNAEKGRPERPASTSAID